MKATRSHRWGTAGGSKGPARVQGAAKLLLSHGTGWWGLPGADALRRAIGDDPMDLDRMPPATSWCGDALLVKGLRNAVGCGNALLAQVTDGGLYEYHRGWLVVVHGRSLAVQSGTNPRGSVRLPKSRSGRPTFP
jgi:hypothetical protein